APAAGRAEPVGRLPGGTGQGGLRHRGPGGALRGVRADSRGPDPIRPPVGPRRGAARPRPGLVTVAGPARAHGGAPDRHQARYGWQRRWRLSAYPHRAAFLPGAVGAARPALMWLAPTRGRARGMSPWFVPSVAANPSAR